MLANALYLSYISKSKHGAEISFKMLTALSVRFFSHHNKAMWSISPYENNNIGAVYRNIYSLQDCLILQEDLDSLALC